MAVSYTAVMFGDLNMKERLFVALAWMPKATVQAAIGPLALDKAKQALSLQFPDHDCRPVVSSSNISANVPPLPGAFLVSELVNGTEVQGYSGNGGDLLASMCDMITYGDRVLTIAVLVILITAPIGAVAIMTGGPKLLQRDNNSKVKSELD